MNAFPPWLQIVMSAVLGVSVTLNIALLLRSSEMGKLRGEMRKDRHDLRNETEAVGLQTSALHQDFAQLIALKHPELVGTLPRTIR